MAAPTCFPIVCTDPDGIVRTFFCELRELLHEQMIEPMRPRAVWAYLVHLRDPHQVADDDVYSAEFIEIDDATVLSRTLANQEQSHYRRKGISDALFADVVKRSRRRLVSSSNKSFLIDDTEYRSDLATKMWERLRKAGKARLLDEEDRYEFIP